MVVDPLLEPQFRAVGRRLHEARLARGVNPRALEPELRTTYRHLLAIEEGHTRLFYSESFYYDLFTRYALLLGFSLADTEQMIALMQTPVPPLGSEGVTTAPNSLPPPQAEVEASGVSTEEPAGQAALLLGSPAISPSATAADPQSLKKESVAPDPLQTKRSYSLLPKIFYVFLIALVLALWMVSQENDDAPPAVPALPERDKSEAPAGGNGTAGASPAASASTGGSGAEAAAPQPAALTNPQPPAPAADVALGAAPATPTADAVSVPTPVSAAPQAIPELELTFRTKGWIWVREANDVVREFVVPEGGTVRFQEMPIFIVLPAPDQIDVRVIGRTVSLKRTEDDKNHGRYTRTMLRQAANLGRLPSPSAN
jgi:hypothetical protein